MKDFFIKNKKPVFIAAIILVLVFIFTTAAISNPSTIAKGNIDDISTCSIPEGKIIAHGIDVSVYQGEIDFEQVKESGFSFVIIKAGSTGFGADANFEKYYKAAQKAGLDIGCYYYTYSVTPEGAKADADELLRIIKGMIESNTGMINAFCNKIKRKGYYPGVYTSTSVYNNYVDSASLVNTWDFWIASYDDHTYNSDAYHKDFSMWQYSNAGIVNGIDHEVDLDVSYVDYPKLTKEFKDKILGL